MKTAEELFEEIMEELNSGVVTVCSYQSSSDDVLNEDTIIGGLKLKKFKTTEVRVYLRDEGDFKPHFHIIGDDGNYESCVRIDTNEYFLHKPNHIKMINRDLQTLDSALRKKRDGGITNWEFGKQKWNKVHYENPIPNSVKQPDYTTLNEVKK